MNFLGFGNSASFVFKLTSSVKDRPRKSVRRSGGETEDLVIFLGDEPVRGEVTVVPKRGKVDHIGIKIELVGEIELAYDRGNAMEFTSMVRELEAPGTLLHEKTYAFDFSNVDKPYESYNGISAKVRYFLRATVSKNYNSTSTKEQEFWVQKLQPEPEVNNPIKMEVGIDGCLHIEFEYERSKYALTDAVVGKIYFMLTRIKIKYMELCIVRKEKTGAGENSTTESDTITKFEVMDGCPVRGEHIPVS